MSLDSRDPRGFLTGELSRLKDRFHRLTGQFYDQLLQEDVSNQGPQNMATDIRKHVRKGAEMKRGTRGCARLLLAEDSLGRRVVHHGEIIYCHMAYAAAS